MEASLLFLVVQSLFFLRVYVQAKSTESLVFDAIHKGKVAGCYMKDESSVHMCFHITRREMRIQSLNGDILASYHTNSAGNIHYIQVLGTGLIRYQSVETTVPVMVSRTASTASNLLMRKLKRTLCLGRKDRRELLVFIKEVMRLNNRSFSFGTKRRKELSENEVATFGTISLALKRHALTSRIPEIMQPFHLLCMSLVQSFAPSKSFELKRLTYSGSNIFPATRNINQRAAKPLFSSTAIRKSVREIARNNEVDDLPLKQNDHPIFTRPRVLRGSESGSTNEQLGPFQCGDMRNGSDRHCFGMCGTNCWCWDWVCGDCCLHKGCLQHDACCRHNGYLSTFCLCPWIWGFDCDHGYGGYPECLSGVSVDCHK